MTSTSLESAEYLPDAPSPLKSFYDPDLEFHALTVEEIQGIVKQCGTLAGWAKQAGADAIQIHAHNGYLIDQFMTELWNKRTDEYGGTLEKRMRFPIEIVNAIREAVGEGFPIIFRITCDQRYPGVGGRTVESTIPMLKILEEAGVDAFDLDSAVYESIDWIFPTYYLGDDCMLYNAEGARAAGITISIINAGNHTADKSAEAIEKASLIWLALADN